MALQRQSSRKLNAATRLKKMRMKWGIVEFGNKKGLGHLSTIDGVADCDSKNAGT